MYGLISDMKSKAVFAARAVQGPLEQLAEQHIWTTVRLSSLPVSSLSMSFASSCPFAAIPQVAGLSQRSATPQLTAHVPQLLQLSHWRPFGQSHSTRQCVHQHGSQLAMQAFVTQTRDLANTEKVRGPAVSHPG